MEIMEESELNSDKIWKIQKKSRLNCEKIWKIWKKGKLNREKIWKIWKKVVKRYKKIRKKPKLNSEKIWKIQRTWSTTQTYPKTPGKKGGKSQLPVVHGHTLPSLRGHVTFGHFR